MIQSNNCVWYHHIRRCWNECSGSNEIRTLIDLSWSFQDILPCVVKRKDYRYNQKRKGSLFALPVCKPNKLKRSGTISMKLTDLHREVKWFLYFYQERYLLLPSWNGDVWNKLLCLSRHLGFGLGFGTIKRIFLGPPFLELKNFWPFKLHKIPKFYFTFPLVVKILIA